MSGLEDERAIVRRAISGDTGALGALLEKHEPRLRRMVALRLDERLRGRVDPADVVQECYTKLLATLERFLQKDGLSFFVWLHLETGDHLRDVHRRHLAAQARDVRAEVPLFVHGGSGASSFALTSAILDGRNTPSRAAIRDEQRQQLLEAVEEMKELDREVLMLRSFEQLTNKEVAQVLGVTESTATLRYVRALERLRETLVRLELAPEGSG